MKHSPDKLLAGIKAQDPRSIARAISLVEDGHPNAGPLLGLLEEASLEQTTLGITGPGGAGKSTLTQKLIAHYRGKDRRVGVIAIDPSSPISGGAILGDRVRMMHHALDPNVVIRSMATRGRIGGLCAAAGAAVRILAASGCDPVIVETVGVGQAEIDVVRLTDLTVLVMAPGLGDDIQAMKAGLVELADVLVVNKADRPDAEALAMDMEPVARERNRRLCRTCAADGAGVAELAAAIDETHRAARDAGLRDRRLRCRRAEILDWAVEMLRPRLREVLESHGKPLGDPRQAARELLESVGLQTPNPHSPSKEIR